MKNLKLTFLLAALALVSVFAVACGGDSVADETPEEVLRATFTSDADEQIESGVVDIAVSVDAGSTGEFSFALNGPFATNLGEGGEGEEGDVSKPEPDFALDGSLKGTVQGQSVELTAGLTSVGGQNYLTVGEESYELPEDSLEESAPVDVSGLTDEIPEDGDIEELVRRLCLDGAEETDGDPAECDAIESDKWLTLTNEGEKELNGDDTVLITGSLDFPALITNIAEVAARLNADSAPDQSEIDEVSDLITVADFEVHTGAEDTLLRQLKLTLTLDPTQIPEAASQPGAPTEPVTIEVLVTISDINEGQSIAAPADAKSIDELDPNSLGGGFLGGLLGGFTGSSDSDSGFGVDGLEGLDPGDIPTDNIPEVDSAKTEAYLQCLQDADQTDVDALQECYALLVE